MTKTTIDIEKLNELKAYAAINGIKLKEFVNQAIKEKLWRESGQSKLPLK